MFVRKPKKVNLLFCVDNDSFFEKFDIENPSKKLLILVGMARNLQMKETSLDFTRYSFLSKIDKRKFEQSLNKEINDHYKNIPLGDSFLNIGIVPLRRRKYG